MRRRARTIDVAASALAHVLPGPLARAVDQARLDASSIFDGLRGRRTPSFSTREEPLVRPTALATIDPVYELLPDPLARRYATFARDLRTVTRELRGHRMPAVVPRAARPVVREEPTPIPTRRTLTVRSLVHETTDALAIELADANGAIHFVPGQFLTLHLTIDGRPLRRAYSISSTPFDGRTATIVVKRIENGLVSSHLHRTLRVGDTLEVTGPSGSFVVPPASAPRHLVLFAGGSGITPVFSILRTALVTEPGARITLVFGNRREADVIFRDRLDALAAEHTSRFRLVHLLEEAAARPHRLGRPDAATITSLVGELALRERMPGEDAPLFFVCGPAAMMASVRRALSDAGILDARIREERFLSPADPAARVDLPETAVAITVRRRGALRTFTQQPGETILEAANRNGAELPSSCTMGGCGACRCRAVSGEVAVDEPSCLTDAERAEGYVLTCVGRARGPVTLEAP
jgi:ring-1,2-phenylacetyl-CoA epoxidase subunit PaaE